MQPRIPLKQLRTRVWLKVQYVLKAAGVRCYSYGIGYTSLTIFGPIIVFYFFESLQDFIVHVGKCLKVYRRALPITSEETDIQKIVPHTLETAEVIELCEVDFFSS